MKCMVRFCMGLIMSSVVSYAAYSATVEFSLSDTTWTKLYGFDVVELRCCDLAEDGVGMPNLPRLGVRILIPQDMKVTGISMTCTTATTLEDSFCMALLRKELSGEAMAKEAATLIAKWKSRGLVEAVLQGIRTDVFNVSAPIAP